MMRLLSYNIHKGIGGRDRRYEFERVLRVVEHERADIVCLQEVTWKAHRTDYHDQPELLARHFNVRGFNFQLNVRYQRRGGGYGNLVLSRWPFAEASHVCLRQGRWKPRGAQLVVVDTPHGPVHVANWHLGLRESERHWQVDRLLQHDHFRRSGELPTVVVGDFNDWRNTLADGPFSRHAFGHVTGPVTRFRSFPAFLPILSLDKAFVRGGVAVKRARVVETPLARRASDHLPLVIDFHLAGKPADPFRA
jgi:endonuclease/exonuclease/phosphatase family metal-dependent hydrolase